VAAVAYVPARHAGLRFIAQDILTGEFLHWNLPISQAERTHTLSGPGGITGVIEPEHLDLLDARLTPHGTWIHAEQDGQIRASGIVEPSALTGDALSVDCAGFTAYPGRVPYRGDYEAIGVDPLDVVRHIWAHVQSYPAGNIGVTLDATTSPVRIGTPPRDVSFETGGGEQVDFQAGPYTLNWWTATNCGQEIDQLARETPFDYLERPAWNAARTDVLHHLVLGYPRVGRKRTDLKFVQDENISDVVPVEEDPDRYASEVIVTGAGEGRDMIQGSAALPPDGRIRVPVVLEDSTITSRDRATAVARDELERRRATIGVKQIVVNTHHENAVLGSFAPGDDILVQAEVPYLGRIALWHRITGFTVPEDGHAPVSLRRSETFNFGGG